ncbi:AbrB family transcriptional regulator [Rhodoplanes elegans]|uniref:AbrB family transcriptional regulator n=1 Tax=Rhodoplanes elegans TaxID=29408 RepID=A0A327KQH6_9BRAD|nr:AbrB/MazE/SpoVT family DNA-binding domain-containing protein [Rhodoplanes elegans]MBK5960512.1 AbrB family transcriptional regulator [Rhodoplanes elegans]RAI40194.1 AbrB family transcriptional regulator [Rhodoplanes elegans]
MQVAKWGDSLAVRLPKEVVEVLGLQEGSTVELRVAGPATFEIASAPTIEEILAQAMRLRADLADAGRFVEVPDDGQGRLF